MQQLSNRTSQVSMKEIRSTVILLLTMAYLTCSTFHGSNGCQPGNLGSHFLMKRIIMTLSIKTISARVKITATFAHNIMDKRHNFLERRAMCLKQSKNRSARKLLDP